MDISLPDLVDRFTILQLKQTLGKQNVKNEYVQVFAAMMEGAAKYNVSTPRLAQFIERLLDANRSIWNLEYDLRRGAEGQLAIDEVGLRAIRIRDHNRLRVAAKNEMAHEVGSGFEDVKTDHASA